MALVFLIILLCLSSPLSTLLLLDPFSDHLPSLVSHSGLDDYDSQRPLSYPNTDIILVCFAIDNPNSFANVHTKWVPEVQHFCPNVPFLLIATKKDEQQIIGMEQGRTMSDRVGACNYLECSAMTREGVREVFIAATHVMLTTHSRRRRCCTLL